MANDKNNKGSFYSAMQPKHHGENTGEWDRSHRTIQEHTGTRNRYASSDRPIYSDAFEDAPAQKHPSPLREPHFDHKPAAHREPHFDHKPAVHREPDFAPKPHADSDRIPAPRRAVHFEDKPHFEREAGEPMPRREHRPMPISRDGERISAPRHAVRFDRDGDEPMPHIERRPLPRPHDDEHAPRFDRIPAPRFDRRLREEGFAPRTEGFTRPDFDEETAENILAGRNPIREALKAGRAIERILVQKGELSGSAREILAMAHEARIVIQEVEKSRLDAIYPTHQGMIAYASAGVYSTVEEMIAAAEAKGEAPFLIVLDGITDPHNLGAIMRTAECAGAHGVIIGQRRSVGLTPAAVKASAGASEYMPIAKVVNITRTLEELKEKGVWIIGADMDGQDADATDFSGACALVIGAEGEGISRLVREACDLIVSLPIKGHIDSLNASVAAGILMYRVCSCRRK